MTVDPNARTEVIPGDAAPTTPPDVLTPGVELGGRWRIERMVGRGGMGAVYAARDRELDVEVAVKVLLAGSAGAADAQRRFKREVQLARAITHSNVCRLFDLGIDEGRDLLFLTMELVQGVTLRARLADAGPLAQGAAWPIAKQIGAALEAAHEAGVIHRDLKAANVMLVGERAVVMDFGISAPSGEDAVAAGTPGYMAPEQATGAPPAAVQDVYAFGALLFEIVAGRLPEPGESARAAGAKIDARWDAAIARALAADPAQRFASVAQLVRALEPPRRTRWWLAAAGVGAAAAAMAGIVAMRSSEHRPAPPQRPAIAVLPFAGVGVSADMPAVIEELLAIDLGAGERAIVVDRSRLGTLATAQAPGAAPSPTGCAELVKAAGIDLVVTGRVLLADGRLEIMAGVIDARTCGLVDQVTRVRPAGQLADLVVDLGEEVLGVLGIDAPSARDRSATRAALPNNPGAARSYARGVAYLRNGDVQRAASELETAVKLDPEYPLAHAELSIALEQLGYDHRAQDEARRAFELGKSLPRAQYLLVEARLRIATRAMDRAIEIYRALSELFPDDLEYALALAETELAAGRAADAMRTLDRIAGRGAVIPRAQLVRADALIYTGDRDGAIRAANEAIAGARALGLWHVEAEALLDLVSVMNAHGRTAEATAAAEAATALYRAHDDKRGLALAKQRSGIVLVRSNQADKGLPLLEQSLAMCQEIGDRGCENTALTTLAIAQRRANDLEKSLASARRALETATELGDDTRRIDAAIAIGNTELALGHDAEADTQFAFATKLAKETGNNAAGAIALGNRGSIAARRGETAAASTHYAAARDAALAAKDPATAAWAEGEAAWLDIQRGRADGARLAKVVAAGEDPVAVASAQCRIGLLALRTGPVTDGSPLVLAVRDAGEEDLAQDLALSWAIAAADRGAPDVAAALAARVSELGDEISDGPARIAVANAAAARAGAGDRSAALAALAKAKTTSIPLQIRIDRERALALTGAARKAALDAVARRAALHELRLD